MTDPLRLPSVHNLAFYTDKKKRAFLIIFVSL